jgi:hypothetical protein
MTEEYEPEVQVEELNDIGEEEHMQPPKKSKAKKKDGRSQNGGSKTGDFSHLEKARAAKATKKAADDDVFEFTLESEDDEDEEVIVQSKAKTKAKPKPKAIDDYTKVLEENRKMKKLLQKKPVEKKLIIDLNNTQKGGNPVNDKQKEAEDKLAALRQKIKINW